MSQTRQEGDKTKEWVGKSGTYRTFSENIPIIAVVLFTFFQKILSRYTAFAFK